MTESHTGDLSWLLDDLVAEVESVRRAAFLSTDGLVIGASNGLTREDAEHLAAVAAAFQGLARGAARHFDGGEVRQSVIEMDRALLFITIAAQGTSLAVLSDADADVGVLAYEMTLLVKRVGQHLATEARPAESEEGG